MPSPHLEIVQKILEEEGYAKPSNDSKDLPSLLNKHRLSPDDLLGELRDMIDGESPHLKMRGIEAGLKLNKMLEEDSKPVPTFIINIQGATDSKRPVPEINPILLPRELQ